MKVLFIAKSLKMEPLGLMYLSAAAKNAGHEVELAIADDNIYNKVMYSRPDIIGYSVMTGDQKFYMNLNRQLKELHNFISIFGGPHPTFFPELIWEEGVDVTCTGEGEEAFVDFLNKCENYNKFVDAINRGEKPEIPNIKIYNLSIKMPNPYAKQPGEPSFGTIGVKPIRPLSKIDSLIPPDRSLVRDFPKVFHCPIKHFIASRGCPYKCTYCFNEKYSEIYKEKGKRVRHRKVELLVDEIAEATYPQEYNKIVYFQDDTFTINKHWLKDFAEEYKKRVFIPFHCHVRANTINKEVAKLLKAAGCRSVHMAIECANDRIRNDLLNRNMSKEQILEACRILKEYDIKIMTQNMIGLPTGTIEDDLDTLELNIKCKPSYAWVSIYQPYPGTELGEFCIKNQLYTGDFSDLGSNFFDGSPLNLPEEYKKQIKTLQKVFATWVEHPNQYSREALKYKLSQNGFSEIYDDIYQKERERGDEVLYGFKL